MPKRLTDTEKWFDQWFRKLPIEYKLFWNFICDRCDNAGVWKVDIDLANFVMGTQITALEALKMLEGRVTAIREGYWLLEGFISFQYGVLSPKNRFHASVLSLLDRDGASKALPRAFQGPNTILCNTKDVKEVKDVRGDSKGGFVKPVVSEIEAYAKSVGLAINAQHFWDHYESNGWKVSKNPMKDWKASVRNWCRNEFRQEVKNGTDVGKGVSRLAATFERARELRKTEGLRKVSEPAIGQVLAGVRGEPLDKTPSSGVED